MFTPRTVQLPATASFHRRVAVWAPMPHPYPDRLCILTVDPRDKYESDWYFVEEWPSREHGTRRFQLVKQAGDKPESVVQIGLVKYCTCPAGSKGRSRECKHRAAIEALFSVRPQLPDPELFDEFSPVIGAEAGK